MENLERLSSSVAQVELLILGLKRENRDLSHRLAQQSSTLKATQDLHQVELGLLKQQLHEAGLALREDPALEARAHRAELDSAELARQLDEARRRHLGEKGALEAEIQRLRSEALTGRFEEQLPVASESALREAQEAAVQAQQALEALKARQGEQDKRVTALESHALDIERLLSESQLRLAESAKPEEVAAWQARLTELEAQSSQAQSVLAEAGRLDTERQALRRQKAAMAAYARERQALRRKVEELVVTLQSVRLG